LSDDLIDWFDLEFWRLKTIGVFSQAATPGQLLESAPTVIWPGFMPANFLPLIGNTTGDWLCVKVDESGFASRIFHWYHGGGDWLPWGESLSTPVNAYLPLGLSETRPIT
jgi:hypothetical protein